MRIAIVSLSPLATDARVLRTATTLVACGHTVLVAGYAPTSALPGIAWHAIAAPRPGWANRLRMLAIMVPANVLPAAAAPLYWLDGGRRALARAVLEWRPDVVHANDWAALPIARLARQRCGAQIVYDAHELAIAEHEERLLWRICAARHVAAIESAGIADATVIVTVSPGIARLLQAMYSLVQPPITIRNVPAYQPNPLRGTAADVTVLWHGAIAPGRGLEALLDSVAMWPSHMRLVIRGGGNPDYVAALLARAQVTADRVELHPAVPPGDVVAAASTADIGLIPLPGGSRNHQLALPNKLFEYMMAGLALGVADLPEMASVIRSTSAGFTFAPEPEAIASALAQLSTSQIDAYKRRALEAAHLHCWEMEKRLLESIYAQLAAMKQRP